MTASELETRFTYHAPGGNQPARYTRIRAKAYEMAMLLNELTPESREQALAFTALEEAVMWANAAIARWEEPILARREPPPADAR